MRLTNWNTRTHSSLALALALSSPAGSLDVTRPLCYWFKMSVSAMDNEIELARLAKEAFDTHRYESCLSSLNKLQECRRSDGRVAHNRAVAQYLLSNLTLTDGFKKSLLSVNAQVLVIDIV